ncbi:MAG: hypothetical protein WC319_05595 [Candidatus Paceibacterota bacterium]|jgi:hypothetical protein
MKFTIVKYPSKYSEDGFNNLLIRIIDGAIVGMVDPCAVDDLRQALGLAIPIQSEEIDDLQLRLPFDEA